ncbi:MAG: hypothetical protein ACTSW2_03340 [Alphaproteobacteria bacterium]
MLAAPSTKILRDHFLGWQCRLRQLSVRNAGGRPTSGMRPDVVFAGEERAVAQVTVLIIKADPGEEIDRFRHFYRRTNDPADRHKAAITYLSAGYYQRPAEFSDEMSALFGPGADLAERLCTDGRCFLRFAQYEQSYAMPCRVRALDEADPTFQATYWHNTLFNPDLPEGTQILGFQPEWEDATADPAVRGVSQNLR